MDRISTLLPNIPRKQKAFTLLELLIVIGILASLVAISLPFYKDYVNQANFTKARTEMDTFANALAQYDQLELTMYNVNNDMTRMIGKYLQDFRSQPGMVIPNDPWGNSYSITASVGVVLSLGPDGINQSAAGIVGSQGILLAQGDDLLLRWKSPFYVVGARYGGPTTYYVDFSRKLDRTNSGNSTNYALTPVVAGGVFLGLVQEDPTIVKITLTTGNLAAATTYVVVGTAGAGSIMAQDGANRFDFNPVTNVAGASATFVSP